MRPFTQAGWVLAAALSVLGGCDINIDPDTLVRALRVLSIGMRTGDAMAPGPQASDLQAQIMPGAAGLDLVFTTDSVTLDALVASVGGPAPMTCPAGSPMPPKLQHDWFLCVGLRSLYSPGTLDPACRMFGAMDPDPRTSSSLVYLNASGMMAADGGPALTLPTAVLKDILGKFVQTALGGGTSGMGGMGGPMLPMRPMVVLLPILLRSSYAGCQPDPIKNLNSEVAYAYLRVIIAVPALGIMLPPPNKNPQLAGPMDKHAVQAGPQMDGMMQPLSPCLGAGAACTPYAVDSTNTVFIDGEVQDGSVETYTPLDDSGREGLAETLRFSWFSTDGEFTQERTGVMLPKTQWKNGDKYPAPAKQVQIWLVVQDERGGADWQQYALQLP